MSATNTSQVPVEIWKKFWDTRLPHTTPKTAIRNVKKPLQKGDQDEAPGAKKKKVASKDTIAVTIPGLENMVPKLKPRVNKMTSKNKGSDAGTSSALPQHPPIRPEYNTQLSTTPLSTQPEITLSDANLQEELLEQPFQSLSPPHAQSIQAGEGSQAHVEIMVSDQTIEPSSSQPALPLSPLDALGLGKSCLPSEISASCSLVSNAVNQLFQQLASHSEQANKSLESSREKLKQLQKVLEDTKPQAARDLLDAQENLHNENIQQQQAFEAEKKKFEEKISGLEDSRTLEKKRLEEKITGLEDSLKLEKNKHEEALQTSEKNAEERIAAVRAELPGLVKQNIKGLFYQYAKRNEYSSPEWSKDEIALPSDGDDEASDS